MSASGLLKISLAISLATFVAAANATVVYSDGTFNPGNYVTQTYRSVPGATVVTGQTLTGGNPGAAATVTYNNNGLGPTDIIVGFFRPDFTYNPAVSGAIQGIDVSLDRYFQPFLNGAPIAVGAFSLRTFVEQGGAIYQAIQTFGAVTGAYTTLSAVNLTAADFGLFDFVTGLLLPAVHPNFSAPIEFGFGIRASTTDLVPNIDTGDARADNLLITVNTARTVPEPSTLALALLTLAIFSRSWKKKSRG